MSAKPVPKLQLVKSQSADDHRCQHRTPSGRRCKLPIEAKGQMYCYSHNLELRKKLDALDLKEALLTGHQGFQTAQGINNSLSNLYKLLANNYISPRRASVLAFISSMLLRTLPAIDADQAAGITDPTAPDEDADDDTGNTAAVDASADVVESASASEAATEPQPSEK